MSLFVPIELFKKHVNADDFSEDDAYLDATLADAEDYIVRATNRTVEELLTMGDGTNPPKSLRRAVMLLAGAWYADREATSAANVREVPFAVTTIVKHFRKLV